MYAAATFPRLENRSLFENWAQNVGKLMGSLSKRNKEASIVLCSIVKHLGNGRALKK